MSASEDRDAFTIPVTPTAFRRVADRLRAAFARHRVPLAGSSIDREVHLLEDMGAMRGRIWSTYFAEPSEQGRIRTAVLALARGQVVAHALERVDTIPGLVSALRRLRELPLAPGAEDTYAGDIYLEIEMCAQLVEAGAK